MGTSNINNPQKCTFVINIHPDEISRLTEPDSSYVKVCSKPEKYDERCRNETVAVNATTEHPSNSYLWCYDQDSINNSVSRPNRSNEDRRQCSDSKDFKNAAARNSYPWNDSDTSSSCYNEDNGDKEQDFHITNVENRSYPVNNQRYYADAYCQTNFQSNDTTGSSDIIHEAETEILNTSVLSSEIPYNEKKDDKVGSLKLENEKMSHEEPNIQELVEMQDINPDPMPKSSKSVDTANHLQFTTCLIDNDESLQTVQSDCLQTISKEIASRETSQFQHFLKDNEEIENSASFTTAYPSDSENWFSKFRRGSTLDTDSNKEELKEDTAILFSKGNSERHSDSQLDEKEDRNVRVEQNWDETSLIDLESDKILVPEKAHNQPKNTCSEVEVAFQMKSKECVSEHIVLNSEDSGIPTFDEGNTSDEISNSILASQSIKGYSENKSDHLCQHFQKMGHATGRCSGSQDDETQDDHESFIETKDKSKETVDSPAAVVVQKSDDSQNIEIKNCYFASKTGSEGEPSAHFYYYEPSDIILEPDSDSDSFSVTACTSYSDMELSDDEDFPGIENGSGCVSKRNSSPIWSSEIDSCYASQRSPSSLSLSKRDLEKVIQKYTTIDSDEKHQNITDDCHVKYVNKKACYIVNHITEYNHGAVLYKPPNEKCCISRENQCKDECQSLNMESCKTQILALSGEGSEPCCQEYVCSQCSPVSQLSLDISARKNTEPQIELDGYGSQSLDALTSTKQMSLNSNEKCIFEKVPAVDSLCFMSSLSIDKISLQGTSIQKRTQNSTHFDRILDSFQTCSPTESENGLCKDYDESLPLFIPCSNSEKEPVRLIRRKSFKRRRKRKSTSNFVNKPFEVRRQSLSSNGFLFSSLSDRAKKVQKVRCNLRESHNNLRKRRFRKSPCSTSNSNRLCYSSSDSQDSSSELVSGVTRRKRRILKQETKKHVTTQKRVKKSSCSTSASNPSCYSSTESPDSSSRLVSGVTRRERRILKQETKKHVTTKNRLRKLSCSTSAFSSLCYSSPESPDSWSSLVSDVTRRPHRVLKQGTRKQVTTQQCCNSCHLLLTIPNPKCKRHQQPRLPFPEGNAASDDIDRIDNRGNCKNSLKKELSQSNIVDSGIGSASGKCQNSYNSSKNFKKFTENCSLQRDTSSILLDLAPRSTVTLDNPFSMSTIKETLNESPQFSRIGDYFPQKGFNTGLCSSDSENDDRRYRTSIWLQRKHKYRKTSAKNRGKGLRLKVLNQKDCRYQPKVLKEYFSNRRQLLKSFVKDIHVSHRSYVVFTLGSYFDKCRNGRTLTTQERMQYEWLRLATFSNYTGNGNAIALARNGIYHDNAEGPSSTRCFLCDFRRSNWERYDDVSVEHRRQSPNCPFHENSGQVSVNISITSGSTAGGVSAETTRTSAPVVTLTNTATTATSSITSAVSEASRGLQRTQISEASSSGAESIPQQPSEDPESRDRSMLALPQTRNQRALGRTGHTYSTIIAPRRNNVATGATSNVGIDPSGNGSSTGSQVPGYRPSAIIGGPVGSGAFSGFGALALNTGSQTSVPRATEGLQGSSAQTSSSEGATGAPQTNPTPGAGGRTDPNITVVVDNPKHPDYLNLDSRIGSYEGWPTYLDQTPRQMSEAGFFYVGVADFTRCFCCGGGLRNWEPGDDPLLEHTRWFPRCEYVNKLKGERYVAAVQRRHLEHMAEQQRQQLELAQRRDENRNPPDPMTTDAAAVMREMGYSVERTREAILAVRQQTGSALVTTQQVLTWLLDDEERRQNGDSDLGVRPPPSAVSSTETTVVGTSIASSVIFTGASIASSLVFTGTSIGTSIVNTTSSISTATSVVSAGTTTSTVSSTSTSTTAEVQLSGTPASTTTEGSSSGTENQQTGSVAGSGSSSSSNSASGTSVEKQSGASGGDSDEAKSAAKEGATSTEPKSKAAKKKSAKKKAKNKAGTKSETAGATGEDLDAKSLKAENEKLREMQTCKICMERAVNTTLLPCGHLVCCDTCAARLQRCPICRKRIKGTVKTFMS